MKALEKDRKRRYETASAFAEDIQRYLCGEQVFAYPPSFVYRIRKQVRKNLVAITTAGLVMLALFVGTIATGWQAWVSSSNLTRAREAEETATREAAVAKALNTFLNDDVLAQVNPKEAPDPNLTMREVLDRAAETLDGKFQGESEIEAELRSTLGSSYKRQGVAYNAAGRKEDAVDTLRQVYQGRQSLHGDIHRNTIGALQNLVIAKAERDNLEETESGLRKVLNDQTALLGNEHPAVAISKDNLANVLKQQAKFQEAAVLRTEAYAKLKTRLGMKHALVLGIGKKTLQLYTRLADIEKQAGNLEEMIENAESAIAIADELFKANPEEDVLAHSMANSWTFIAIQLIFRDRFDEAEERLSTAIAQLRALANRTDAMNDTLASSLRHRALVAAHHPVPQHRELNVAEESICEAIKLDPDNFQGYQTAAIICLRQGDATRAVEMFERAESLFNEANGTTLLLRAWADHLQGNATSAKESLAAAIERLDSESGTSTPTQRLREEVQRLVEQE